ncbi:MAG: putative colanic acid biosynthesis acetyltransferase [Alteraurantiacibacter sp.]
MQSLRTVPPTSLANRAARGIWGLVWLFLYRPSPRPFHAWRRMLLRMFGAKVEAGAKPYPSATIWAPWNLVMRHGSTLGDGVDCYSVAVIELSPGATVSQRAFLCSASRDYDDPAMPLATAPIRVGPKAWVAAECFVGPGVELGEGAVCAARAVVTRDVPEWTVVAGSPAKALRERKRF